MTSKKRDALKVAIFEGNVATLYESVSECAQAIGIPKTLGVLISLWSQSFLSPDEDSISWGFKAWTFDKSIKARQSRVNRQTHLIQLTDMAQSLSALPIHNTIPSFNNNELFSDTSLRQIHKMRPFNPCLSALIKRHALRPARAYLYELLQCISELNRGAMAETQERIWRILNTLLSTFSLSTLKRQMSEKSPVWSPVFDQHILMLIWNLVVVDAEFATDRSDIPTEFSLEPMATLFLSNIVSHKQLDQRLPILYVTCMYRPFFVSMLRKYKSECEVVRVDVSKKKTQRAPASTRKTVSYKESKRDSDPQEDEDGRCDYLFSPLLEESPKPVITPVPLVSKTVRIRGGSLATGEHSVVLNKIV